MRSQGGGWEGPHNRFVALEEEEEHLGFCYSSPHRLILTTSHPQVYVAFMEPAPNQVLDTVESLRCCPVSKEHTVWLAI